MNDDYIDDDDAKEMDSGMENMGVGGKPVKMRRKKNPAFFFLSFESHNNDNNICK